ncbi:MAG: outer membrane protein assembly factor BamB [Pirellulaceae bacterium]|jgi:outer membrane protein assembly factor BamB
MFLARFLARCLLWCSLFFLAVNSSLAEDWTRFRGPNGQGISLEKNLPTKWSATENIAWTTAIDVEGWSSPIVSGDQVFISGTTNEGVSCHVIAFDRITGKVLWNTKVFDQETRHKRGENSYATPTPTTDGKRVYAVFAAGSIAAVDFSGELDWVNHDVKFYSHHGLSSSPILVAGLLVMPFDGSSNGGDNKVGWKIPWKDAVLLALDTETGKAKWRGKRGLSRLSHGSPCLMEVNGKQQIVSGAGDVVQGHDPTNGNLIWTIFSQGEGVSPSVVVGGGHVYSCSGFEASTIRVIRGDGNGDVTNTHITWEQKEGVPSLASPLYVAPHLYAVTDKGVASCFDAKSGKIVWQERIGGKHSVSPTLIDGNIYFFDELTSEATIIKAGAEFKLVGTNSLDGEIMKASPAISQGNIFVRTAAKLLCIGPKPTE